jgi:hypothetical protein
MTFFGNIKVFDHDVFSIARRAAGKRPDASLNLCRRRQWPL